MILVGLLVGLGMAVVMAFTLENLLFQTSPFDPLVLALSVVFLLVVAVLSVLSPARIALRTEPALMLREE